MLTFIFVGEMDISNALFAIKSYVDFDLRVV